jgi:hypothetical protein
MVDTKVNMTLKSRSPLNMIVQLLEPAPPGEHPLKITEKKIKNLNFDVFI